MIRVFALLCICGAFLSGCGASDVSMEGVKDKERQIKDATQKADPNVDMTGRSQGQ